MFKDQRAKFKVGIASGDLFVKGFSKSHPRSGFKLCSL